MSFVQPPIGTPTPGESGALTTPRPLQLRAEGWPEYFRLLERESSYLSATVEVVRNSTLNGGAARRPVREIRYDARLRLLELAVGAAAEGELPVRYFVCDPRAIRVLELDEVIAILVEDARGVCTLIRLYPGWGSLQEGSGLDST